MTKLTIQEKLDIANSGGSFQVSGLGSWVGTKIRKGKKLGKVIEDWNGRYRELIVKFEDGAKETITLNNIGTNLDYVHKYEWFSKQGKCWYKF